MNNFANYAFEANTGFMFFYGMYYLLLRNETDFRKQRIFRLSGLFCSLVFPLIAIPVWVYFLAAFVALSTAGVTLSYQALKAALVNPVKSLQSD